MRLAWGNEIGRVTSSRPFKSDQMDICSSRRMQKAVRMDVFVEVTALTLQKAMERSWSESMSWSTPMPRIRIYTYPGFLASSTEVQLRIWVKQIAWSLGGLDTSLCVVWPLENSSSGVWFPHSLDGIMPGLLPHREVTIKWKNMSNHFVKCRVLHKCKELHFYWTMNSLRQESCLVYHCIPNPLYGAWPWRLPLVESAQMNPRIAGWPGGGALSRESCHTSADWQLLTLSLPPHHWQFHVFPILKAILEICCLPENPLR